MFSKLIDYVEKKIAILGEHREDMYERFAKEVLPHGSGIDADWRWQEVGKKVIFTNSYHLMSDVGFYIGWIDIDFTINWKEIQNRRFRFWSVGFPNDDRPEDSGNTNWEYDENDPDDVQVYPWSEGDDDMLLDYLGDTFYWAMQEARDNF